MIVTFKKSIKNLFIVWTIVSLLLVLLFLLQSFNDKYGENISEAWSWLLLNVIASALLIFLLLFFFQQKNKQLLTFQLPLLETILFYVVITLFLLYIFFIFFVVVLSAPFRNNEGKNELEVLQDYDTALHISQALIIALLLFFIFRVYKLYAQKNIIPDTTSQKPGFSVFISYSQKNTENANQLKGLFESEKIDVIIDSDDMLISEDIETFIKKSIDESKVTFSVVSKDSLISGWVGVETLDTFSEEKETKKKKFMAGYLDEDFFKLSFTRQAIQKIDLQIAEVEKEKEERSKTGIKTRDIDDLEKRLLYLKENLDEIVQRLRSSLCVDIRNEKLATSFPLIIKSIKQL